MTPVRPLPPMQHSGVPLAPWTYQCEELFSLEMAALFHQSWQFIGHENEWPAAGDYASGDIGGCGVFVIRGKDSKLRAFKNVCRHRGSRIVEGSGRCTRTIVCPYHGWAYNLDGRLRGIPSSTDFPAANKEELGLHEIELDTLHGLVFVRIQGGGPGLAESFGDSVGLYEQYGVPDYVVIAEAQEEVWDVNWKVAFDNYLENYHIPIGHPALQRMLVEEPEGLELTSGLTLGSFAMRDKLSSVDEERAYMENIHLADERLPEKLKSKWVQSSLAPSHGIDLYPELMDVFQLLPLDVDRTLVRTSFYGLPDVSAEVEELRALNLSINGGVNQEDLTLCRRVQKGLATPGYMPGPLSLVESSIHHFHNMVKAALPVAGLDEEPVGESVSSVNQRMLDQSGQAA